VNASDALAGLCKHQQASLQHQLEMLRAGRMRTWEQRGSGSGMIDTTAETLDQVRTSLAELEELFRRFM